LFVTDGGKGIRKALTEVFGDRAIVQRCQVHKARNVRDHLSQERRAYVQRQLREAYQSRSAETAKKMLLQLASWLETNGDEHGAVCKRAAPEPLALRARVLGRFRLTVGEILDPIHWGVPE
jgi:transposase-like protein